MKQVCVVIDTTLGGSYLGLKNVGESQVYWSRDWPEREHSSYYLARFLQDGLAALGCQVNDISGVAVASGPGSFTGIRIGMAFALGLIRGGGEPIRSFCFDLLGEWHRSLSEKGARIMTCWPATAWHGFVCLGDVKDGAIQSKVLDLREPSDYNLCELENAVFLSEWPRLQEQLSNYGVSNIKVLPALDLKVGRDKLLKDLLEENWPHNFSELRLLPNYLRRSTPEEKLFGGSKNGTY